MVKPANASSPPMASLKVIVAPVPEFKVKVRSLLLASSASILSLIVIPPVAVILTLVARLISPVVVNEPEPKLKVAPLKVISAPPLSSAKLLLLLATDPTKLIAPSLLVLLVSMVIAPVLMVVPVTVTELPLLLLVVMLPFRVTLVEPVIAVVLILPLLPIAPTLTVLAEPPDEVIVRSNEPVAVIAPIVMAPPAEVILKFLPITKSPKLMASSLLTIVPSMVTVPLVLSVTPPLKVISSDTESPKSRVPVFWKVTALAKVASFLNLILYP